MNVPQQSARLRPFRPVPFGRYTLLSPLAVGGMGELFLARLEGAKGFEKLCVIKKIVPALASDPEFVDRFVNEANILVKLSHGSIAQVLDVGLFEGDPYIALEFVDGKDLRKVAARARDHGAPLPLTFVLYVMSRVLDALAYAHRKRGDDDREIALVHRDVSPQNLLVSYEGEVKVIDFGLAKSSLSSAQTHPSMILGKFLYMSPEQARHLRVDRRSDLYSAGICLYELICGRNPFDGIPSAELIARVANPNIAPLHRVDPRCPRAVQELVATALQVDPAKRFQSAEEFRAKVLAALMQLDSSAGPESASRYMRESFAAEYQQERRLLASLKAAEVAPRETTRPADETAVIAIHEVAPLSFAPTPRATDSIEISIDEVTAASARAAANDTEPRVVLGALFDEPALPAPQSRVQAPTLVFPKSDPYDLPTELMDESAIAAELQALTAPKVTPGRALRWVLALVFAILLGAAAWFFERDALEDSRPVVAAEPPPAALPAVAIAPAAPGAGGVPDSVKAAQAEEPTLEPLIFERQPDPVAVVEPAAARKIGRPASALKKARAEWAEVQKEFRAAKRQLSCEADELAEICFRAEQLGQEMQELQDDPDEIARQRARIRSLRDDLRNVPR